MQVVGGRILSIGYGDQPWEAFLARLRLHEVQYVVDVRSRPGSRQPEFSRESLAALLGREGVRYVFMGDQLGGMPADPECYEGGKVIYARVRARPFFEAGLQRLRAAVEQGLRVALLCSELDPERCHRSKLIGAALADDGVEVEHISRDGALLSQREVMDAVTGGQGGLFGDDLTSRGRYEPRGEEIPRIGLP